MPFQTLQSALADHIADSQNPKPHKEASFARKVFFSIPFKKFFGNAILYPETG